MFQLFIQETIKVYSLRKIFNPAIFQGSIRNKDYFEGWYFKHVSADSSDAFIVIPGVSLSDDPHAFIQFYDCSTRKSAYYRYDISDFHSAKDRFQLNIGESVFSSDCIGLNLKNEELSVTGKIHYSDIVTLKPTLLRPGIMGPYSYVPGMECNHGVVSVNHFLEGSVYINRKKRVYSGGKGYIEKDWGTSFPESWMWVQCNNFPDEYVSVMFSVGKIPWRGHYFIGFIAFVFFRGKTEIFATYNGSKIVDLKKLMGNKYQILIARGRKKLKLKIAATESTVLISPAKGMMVNRIRESINSEVYIDYSDNEKIIYSGRGLKAGVEVTDGIFRYF